MILNIFTFQSGEFYNSGSFAWETIVAALIAAIVVIIGYNIQKKNDRIAINRENSKKSYLEFINDFTETTVTDILNSEFFENLSDEEQWKHKIDSDRRRIMSRDKLLLFGTDKIINTYLEFIKHIDDISKNGVEDKQADFFNKLLIEIRKEIYPDTKILEKDIFTYFNGYRRP
jgi:hypothetical protein